MLDKCEWFLNDNFYHSTLCLGFYKAGMMTNMLTLIAL